MRLSPLFIAFFESEKVGSLLLIFCTVASLLLSNSDFQVPYLNLWQYSIAGHAAVHWINDGLMAIFFLLIGLELEREIYQGELASIKNALLPIAAAMGGMVVPAAVYMYITYGTAVQSGAGIPMATDIAFAIGVLSLLGNRVPPSLKVFLIALAVIDDLGAILIIAFFYSGGISVLYLSLAAGIFAILFVLNRLKVYVLFPYIIGGLAMWYCMLQSGIHATIAGVLLAFVIPFGDDTESSISYKLQRRLHYPVSFLILPLFALANTSLVIPQGWTAELFSPGSIGIFAGLVFGKPAGIFLFSLVATRLGVCSLPYDIRWKDVIGVGFLGGIGFTMSIFITLLAFDRSDIINSSKMAILISSLLAGLLGFIWLQVGLKKDTS